MPFKPVDLLKRPFRGFESQSNGTSSAIAEQRTPYLWERPDLQKSAQRLIQLYGLYSLTPIRLIRELSGLNRKKFLRHPASSCAHASNSDHQLGLRSILKDLSNPTSKDHVFCPIVEPLSNGNRDRRRVNGTVIPSVLKHLNLAASGKEPAGLLFDPVHIESQLSHWRIERGEDQSLLWIFATLPKPFSRLISPHPLFDCEHYLQQRQLLANHKAPLRTHPILDYLNLSSHGTALHPSLEPSRQFIPSLWERQERRTAPAATAHPERNNPLIRYLMAMDASTTDCPLLNQKMGGLVEGIDTAGVLRGWCRSVKAGDVPELEVWMQGVLLGRGRADQPRTDIHRRGLERRHCGFSIRLDLHSIPLEQLLSRAPLAVEVMTSDGRVSLGRGDWPLKPASRDVVVDHLVRRALGEGAQALLAQWLKLERDETVLSAARYRMLRWVSVSALAGSWDTAALGVVRRAMGANPSLLQGLEAESCGRAELILLALEHLCHSCDHDRILRYSMASLSDEDHTRILSDQLSERCYFSPTALEQQCWRDQLRPLFNLVVATLLNQERPPDLAALRPLLRTLARLSETVFNDLRLAETLTSLVEPTDSAPSAARLRLQLRRGEFLPVAIALQHQRQADQAPALTPFEHALALLELSKQSLATTETALTRLLPLLPGWQERHPRFSFTRRLLDQLGWHVNTMAFALVDELIALAQPAGLGLAVREHTIAMLSRICQALWSTPGYSCMPVARSRQPPRRWLLIGERALSQCWLYRVEQKRIQLEHCGAEVRCIDRGQLDDWSCTEQIAWADAVIFCRTPATYGVIRALTFARHAGKRVLADVDDLVFTADSPAPYASYGGSIQRDQHLRLRLDPPLHRWPLEQADGVVTSTPALAEALHTSNVAVLPNLPLPQLQGLARRLADAPRPRVPQLVVSSGTLAHKQIWAEQLAPAVAELLERHPALRLTLLGHLALPSCLAAHQGRIRHLPYGDYSQYLQQLAEGSICLVPLEPHPTTDGKSAIKWMEASLLGLACVCSPVRAYTDAGNAEEHLLTASSAEEWVSQVERLLAEPALGERLVTQAQEQIHRRFNEDIAEDFWRRQISSADPAPERRKLLVINVFFAPQSVGGATRVAQDQVLDILENHGDRYDVTVLCIDHDPWQDSGSETLPLDVWSWHGARVVRLAVPPRSWADIHDPRVEAFCRRWFQEEPFDLIHCHCCQVLTAAPLQVAQELGIPYLVSLHDGWWLSPELFLVTPGGRVIDPAKPLDHIDGTPTAEQERFALERRSILAGILRGARTRLAVSATFRDLYERAGVEAVEVLENRWTPMLPAQPRAPRSADEPLRLCHIGGMAAHKGYPVLRQAVHQLPAGLNLAFTVIDHRLQEGDDAYASVWNSYPVAFIPPVAMGAMAEFYAGQDVLVAPSIWPESFGLVTREAISAGLWVIAADSGALADPLRQQLDAGAIVPPADAGSLCQAIQGYAKRQLGTAEADPGSGERVGGAGPTGTADLYARVLQPRPSANPDLSSPASRYRLVERCALSALAGEWNTSAITLNQAAIAHNPALAAGVEAESCGRAELIALALGHLCRHWDRSGLHRFHGSATPAFTAPEEAGHHLAAQLSERCHFAPTGEEQRCWTDHLRPLFNVVVATLLHQQKPAQPTDEGGLLTSLASLSEQVFGDLELAETLLSLLEPAACDDSATHLRLQLRHGAFLPVAIALHHQVRAGRTPALEPFDHALALLELSKQSLVTLEAALARLLPMIPLWQARNPRLSFSRRLLDQLGWHINTLSFSLLDQGIDLALPTALGVELRERATRCLEQISQALWADPGCGCGPLPAGQQAPLRWLLIGEQDLPQCWLYRVEQKRLQLEQLGAEVRCIDRSRLDDWSCTQEIAWADAVLFCRTPATYPVIRAFSFARHCGKRVLADVDDLVFSADFTAPLASYGGSISPSQHRRLRLDPPLQRWLLERADGVITSTEALADAWRNAGGALAGQPLSVLPNLPLPKLQGLARRLAGLPSPLNRRPHLVISSGTLAHKQIWAEQVAPVVAELLERHPTLRLTLLGYLWCPSCLDAYAARIRCLPYGDYGQYLQQLSEGSICLIPVEAHPTTDSKSAIKWMEASLLGLACVCSPVRAYTDAGENEQHLLTADDPEQWLGQVERLLADPELRSRLVAQAQQQVHTMFNDEVAERFWRQQLQPARSRSGPIVHQRRKLLVINVFFAPQSVGGATRVAQDQVLELLEQHGDSYDITVLCADHDPWQDASGEQLPIDSWHWHGARIVRLALPPKPWSHIQDGRVEAFCRSWFQEEDFDLIHCHCCQVLTASPLVVAQDLGIPYVISLHDGWWLSPKLFLVSHCGRQINPADPLDHIDGTPTTQDKAEALERRGTLAAILRGARSRLAVSAAFRQLYQDAGIENVDVLENKWTPMAPEQPRAPRSPEEPLRLCHVGGMAMHKGYPLLRQAVHRLPPGLPLQFTVLDHSLEGADPGYTSFWNGYAVRFLPPVSMQAMADFYANQDVLLAPSIWPESFGLVTREALSAGLWVIASEVGALADPIAHECNGTVIQPNDPEALTLAIQSLVVSDDQEGSLRQAIEEARKAPLASTNGAGQVSLHELVYGRL